MYFKIHKRDAIVVTEFTKTWARSRANVNTFFLGFFVAFIYRIPSSGPTCTQMFTLQSKRNSIQVHAESKYLPRIVKSKINTTMCGRACAWEKQRDKELVMRAKKKSVKITTIFLNTRIGLLYLPVRADASNWTDFRYLILRDTFVLQTLPSHRCLANCSNVWYLVWHFPSSPSSERESVSGQYVESSASLPTTIDCIFGL